VSEKIPLDEIHYDEENANVGTDRGDVALEHSISEYGFIEPGILDANNTLIGGNRRTATASDLGMGDATVIDMDGEHPFYIRYKQFDLNSPDPTIRQRSRMLAYELNRIGQLSVTFDQDQLTADIADGLDLSHIFMPEEIEELRPRVSGGDEFEEDSLDEDEIDMEGYEAPTSATVLYKVVKEGLGINEARDLASDIGGRVEQYRAKS
jgi:ParB-like chromosome segregation protein Spo0J